MKRTIITIILFFVFILAVFFSYSYRTIYHPGSGGSADAVFSIKSGEDVKTIARNLHEQGLVSSEFFFLLHVRRHDKDSDFKAGEYSLNPAMAIAEIVSVLTEGRVVSRERTIKIVEGWRVDDIAGYLEREGVAKKEDFVHLVENAPLSWPFSFEKQSFIAEMPAKAGLEGFLFPDTYRIFEKAGAEDVIGKMLDNFEMKIDGDLRTEIARQNRDLRQVITLASLVEKEVRGYEDMRKVAGLFLNRIKNGQALESCATLAYILGVDKAQYSFEDTKINSPYNTYRNPGLPPGPICNPGLNAIKAAIFPEYTDFNYFLSRSDNNETVFSKTYEEHLRNKAKYLR